MQESTKRKIVVQDSPGIQQDPISKINIAKRAGYMAQVVDACLVA
jgi:hypothetical protein